MDTLPSHAENGNSIPEKYCFGCNSYWPATFDHFHLHNKTKDRLQNKCKACSKKTANILCGMCGGKKILSGKKFICLLCSKRRSAEWAKRHPERVNIRGRAYKARNKEKVEQVSRNSKLIVNYGMSLEEYEALLQSQGYVCAICSKSEIKRHRNGTLWSLSVDHDHVTGKVRGLLCSACNVGLANFREDVDALEAAINYLKGATID